MPLHVLHLQPRAPYSFHHSLTALSRFLPMAYAHEVTENAFARALSLPEGTVFCRVQSQGTVDAPQLEVSIESPEPLSTEREAIVRARLETLLGLKDELEPFYHVAQDDDALAPVVAKLYGLHLLKFPTIFEAAVYALMTQRTPNPFAARSMQRLAESLGGVVTVGERRYLTFPTAQAVQDADTDLLLHATNNLRKTERLRAVAEAFCQRDEDSLRAASTDEVAAWLKSIYGFGDWSVDYILSRGLGRHARLPWTDTGISEAAGAVYAGGLGLERSAIREIVRPYQGFENLWLYYLKIAKGWKLL